MMQGKALLPVDDTSFWSLCGFAYDEVQQVRKMLQIHHKIWLYSKLGAGVLYDVFYPATGNLFYFHICDDVLAGKAFCKKGFWEEDMATYPPNRQRKVPSVLDYMHVYEHIKHRFHTAELLHDLFDVPREEKAVDKAQMVDFLLKVAAWTGCSLTMLLTQTTHDARIYDGAMFRFLCLCWLMLLRDISDDQKVQAILYQEAPEITPYMSLNLQCQCSGRASLSQQLQAYFVVMKTYLITLGEGQDVHTVVNDECESNVLSVTIKCFQKPSAYIQNDFKEGHGQTRDYSQRMKR